MQFWKKPLSLTVLHCLVICVLVSFANFETSELTFRLPADLFPNPLQGLLFLFVQRDSRSNIDFIASLEYYYLRLLSISSLKNNIFV